MPRNYRLDADYENAGVGIVVKNSLLNAFKNVKQINGRMMSLTLASYGFDVTIITAYAPHSNDDTEMKENFYDNLSDEIMSTHGRYFVGGDFNARIHFVRETDTDACGPHILGRGMEYLNGMNEKKPRKVEHFSSGFCKMHKLRILNSQFSKPEKFITYKLYKEKANTSDFGPPFDAHRYAQLDYWLTGAAWKRSCADVQSRRDIVFDSDHLLLEARLELLPCQRPRDAIEVDKFKKLDSTQWLNFNSRFATLISKDSVCYDAFVSSLLRAAKERIKHSSKTEEETLHNQTYMGHHRRKKPAYRTQGATNDEVKQLNRRIAKSARDDRQNHLIEQFNENPRDTNFKKRGLWKAVKDLKRKFTAQYVQIEK